MLSGLGVRAAGRPDGPAWRGARALAELGACCRFVGADGGDEALETGSGAVVFSGFDGGRFGGRADPVEDEYAGLRAASALLRGGGVADRGRLAADVREGFGHGGPGARLVRCASGWLVVRDRTGSELSLLAAAVGGDLTSVPAAAAWAAARSCRLLAAPVLRTPRVRTPWVTTPRVGTPRVSTPRVSTPRVSTPRVSTPRVSTPRVSTHRVGEIRSRVVSSVDGAATHRQHATLRDGTAPVIVDWSSLWAGPWATGQFAGRYPTVRVEAPQRRDGLLTTPEGRALWERWNGAKQLMLADVRQAADRARLADVLREADILVDGNTARVLPQLGFDDDWFRRNAPRLTRLSLVAYEPPFEQLPGLGEHGAALGGLLAGPAGGVPLEPLPWADPLLGAWAELTIAACLRDRLAGSRSARSGTAGSGTAGRQFRLSLEGAAARAWLNTRWVETRSLETGSLETRSLSTRSVETRRRFDGSASR